MATSMKLPEAIDLAFVPGFRASVATVPVAEEAVLYDEGTGRLHQLDPIAAVVAHCFDGQATIATTVEELTEAFGVPRTTVAADVLAFARLCGELGLLEGVEGLAIEDAAADEC